MNVIDATELRLTLLEELGPLASWNTRALFAAAPALRRRKLGIANHLGSLCPIVAFQETHGEASDWLGLLPDHYKFVSPHPSSRNKGGVIIAVNREFLADKLHDWDHIYAGRIARLRLPSMMVPEAIVSIYVIHLEGEDNTLAEQLDLIALLKRVIWDDDSDLIMFLGDFNFALCGIEALSSGGSSSSYMHSRLAHEFSVALSQFTAVNPLGFTYLTNCTGLGRCYVNIPLEALDTRGIECSTLPFPSFFKKQKPSDHLPIILRAYTRPRPLVSPLPRAHALDLGWKAHALEELKRAGFGDLSCKSATTMLPILLRRSCTWLRRSNELIDASNDELCLYHAARALRCYVNGDLAAAYHIVHRAPHWRLHLLSRRALLPRLAALVSSLRLRVWTARSQNTCVNAESSSGVGELKDNKRAKVQRWAAILAAWKRNFKQCTH